MTPYTDDLNQPATYWPPGQPDGFGGVGYGAPVPIISRWQDKRDLIRGADGQEFVSSAVVYVSQLVANKGYLFEGESTAANPTTVDGAREVRQAGQSPDLDADEVLIKAWL